MSLIFFNSNYNEKEIEKLLFDKNSLLNDKLLLIVSRSDCPACKRIKNNIFSFTDIIFNREKEYRFKVAILEIDNNDKILEVFSNKDIYIRKVPTFLWFRENTYKGFVEYNFMKQSPMYILINILNIDKEAFGEYISARTKLSEYDNNSSGEIIKLSSNLDKKYKTADSC